MQEITAASGEQSIAASQISTAMSQLSLITQQNASATEELAATAEEMHNQAEQLQQLVSYFKVSGDADAAKHGAIAHRANGTTAGARMPVNGTNVAPLDADPQILAAAIKAHVDWKTKLRMCIVDRSKCADPVTAEKDDACGLGKWMYGDGQHLANDEDFRQLREDHASFHVCAASIIRSVQRGKTAEAEELLAGEYAKISSRVIGKLNHMKSRCKST